MGIPFDMVTQARRKGGPAMEDLQDIARVNITRILEIVRIAGPWLVALVLFVITTLAISGFVYGAEFAQALFCMGFPMMFVGYLNYATARRIRREKARGEHLCRAILRCRVYVQLIGTVSNFFTALWGMYSNISASVLG